MVRETSRAVFEEIRDRGLLSRARFEVYSFLVSRGPMTGSEVNYFLNSRSAHKRLSELLNLGVIREAGTRRCTRTGEHVLAWEVNGSLPIVPRKRKSTPTRSQFAAALKTMRTAYSAGVVFDEDTVRVMRWIGTRARVDS